MISDQFTISVASGGTTSTAFQIGLGFRYVGLLFPAMDDGDIGLAISLDSGANYSPVLDPADGNDLVICGSGDDPGYMDISDYVRSVPKEAFLRITCAAQSSGAVDITVCFKG
jgi:hypothetical protein